MTRCPSCLPPLAHIHHYESHVWCLPPRPINITMCLTCGVCHHGPYTWLCVTRVVSATTAHIHDYVSHVIPTTGPYTLLRVTRVVSATTIHDYTWLRVTRVSHHWPTYITTCHTCGVCHHGPYTWLCVTRVSHHWPIYITTCHTCGVCHHGPHISLRITRVSHHCLLIHNYVSHVWCLPPLMYAYIATYHTCIVFHHSCSCMPSSEICLFITFQEQAFFSLFYLYHIQGRGYYWPGTDWHWYQPVWLHGGWRSYLSWRISRHPQLSTNHQGDLAGIFCDFTTIQRCKIVLWNYSLG